MTSRRTLIVAVSARMLAQLAVADGYDVIAYDAFGDRDLRALCPTVSLAHDLGGAGGLQRLARSAERAEAGALVPGSGLENRPDLVRRLAAGRELLGTAPEGLAQARNPELLAAALREVGMSVPELARGPQDLPAVPAGWLRKPVRGGGGRGVRPWRGEPLGAGDILQERRHGLPCSVVAVGDGRRAAVLAVSEQLVGERRLGARGFRWCGNVVPPRLPEAERRALAAQLTRAAEAVAARFALRGAFGLDAIWDGARAWVIELNPRPPAALELADALRGGGTFDAHVVACRGGGLPPAGTPAGAAGKAVVFAPVDCEAPAMQPHWGAVRDVPAAGEPIRRGAPVCTLVARAMSPGAVVDDLLQRADVLARELAAGALVDA